MTPENERQGQDQKTYEPTYEVEHLHIVSVNDKRDIVIFDGTVEVQISQKAIVNHKYVVGLLATIGEAIAADNGWFDAEGYTLHKIRELLKKEGYSE